MSRRCPGCSVQLQRAPWCNRCRGRMPEAIQQQLMDAETAISRAHARAEMWLRTHPRVTAQELEMIRLAASGASNGKIAAELGIAPRTLQQYWRDLSRRWDCSGRAHIVATSVRLGYLTVEVAR